MSQSEQLLHIVGRIYDAASDATQWPSALSALSNSLGAPIAGLLYHDLSDRSGSISAIVGADPRGTQLYNTHYHLQDPWVARSQAAGLVHPGVVLVGEQVISHKELKRTEYYNDYALAYDGVRVLAGVIVRAGSTFANLSLLRGERLKPFARADVQFIESLMPHFQRAMAIHSRLHDAVRQSAGTGEVLDRLQSGVVLLTESGRVLFANRTARALAATRDGFLLDADGPGASNPSERRQLRRLLVLAGRTDHRDGGMVRLSRPSRKTPLVALVSPLTNPTSLGLGQEALVALFVSDPEVGPELDLAALRVAYGLAPAEAQIAQSLGRGANLREIADEHGLTLNTTRWYVKQILQKTACESQTQLLRRLLTGPAAVRPSS